MTAPRNPLRPRHGDTWAQRLVDGRYRTVIVATNDWPPPDPRWRIELEGAA